jgi:predicted AAA+ superfamily ATPase
MLGQLHDAGNASTLSHYLELLSGAGMITGVQKFAGQTVRQKASSPKLQAYNTALISAQSQYTLQTAKADASYWGRLVESAVAMHLLNAIKGTKIALYYWRERNHEVDFIMQLGKKLLAIEVKSGIKKELLSGMSAFLAQYPSAKPLLIGHDGISLEQFLLTPVEAWFDF